MRRIALVVCLVLTGCGGGEPVPPAERAPRATASPTPSPSPAPRRTVERAHCPSGLEGCREATGRVLYVEAVDPDGDGDAHFVLAGGRITAPGISAIAVRRELRPRRLPEIGDWVSAAGVVWTGSHGQQQIEAEMLNVGRR
jgi:hypothetical protein